jgi:hypothetical protein
VLKMPLNRLLAADVEPFSTPKSSAQGWNFEHAKLYGISEIMKRRLKAFGATAIAILFLCGCERQPPAKPVILEKKLATNVFSDNKLDVRIRNDGRDGWVLLSYGTTDTSTDIEVRRRGKIERTISDAIASTWAADLDRCSRFGAGR